MIEKFYLTYVWVWEYFGLKNEFDALVKAYLRSLWYRSTTWTPGGRGVTGRGVPWNLLMGGAPTPLINSKRNLSLDFLIWPPKLVLFKTKNKGYQNPGGGINHLGGGRQVTGPPTLPSGERTSKSENSTVRVIEKEIFSGTEWEIIGKNKKLFRVAYDQCSWSI